MQAAFEEALAISRRLAEQDLNNAGWQSDLAVAHNRLGGVLQGQGKLTEAMAAFEEALAISRRLAEQVPSNQLPDADALYRRALAIDEASYGPDHPNVARDLNNLAKLLQVTNRLGQAEPLMRRRTGDRRDVLRPGPPQRRPRPQQPGATVAGYEPAR